MTYFGTSPRYLLELEASKVIPREAYDLSSLRLVTTTGATLTADQFRWFYKTFPQIHLSSIAGGTDIVTSCLYHLLKEASFRSLTALDAGISSDPSGPVYAGEMQMVALGMNVRVADANTGEDITEVGASPLARVGQFAS